MNDSTCLFDKNADKMLELSDKLIARADKLLDGDAISSDLLATLVSSAISLREAARPE